MHRSKYGTDEDRNELIIISADRYLTSNTTTFRYLEENYNIPKSTVHAWFHKILMTMDESKITDILIKLYNAGAISHTTFKMSGAELKKAVADHIAFNISMRGIRGAKATRERYLRMIGQLT